jgi:Ca2+-binding EF-hand superfamily protein
MQRAIAVTALIVTITFQASAQQQGRPGEGLRALIQLDANGDQAISRGEVPEAVRASFDVLLKHGDTDENGQLALEEIRALGERMRDTGMGGAADPANMMRRFKAADQDGDGRLSRSEFPGMPEFFNRLDADKDGQLTVEEARSINGAQLPRPSGPTEMLKGRQLAKMDLNGDGLIQREEFRGPAPLFDRLDVDRDGQISKKEGNSAAEGTSVVEPPASPGPKVAGPRRLAAMDTDGDGIIKRAEFKGPPQLFNRLDANQDGLLEAQELERADARVKAQPKKP